MAKISRKTTPAKKPAKAAKPARVAKPARDFAVARKPHDAVAAFRADILRHLTFTLARDTTTAIRMDWWLATCFALRDRVLERFLRTQGAHAQANARRVYYLSLEYLMGRLLRNNLCNLGQLEVARDIGAGDHGDRLRDRRVAGERDGDLGRSGGHPRQRVVSSRLRGGQEGGALDANLRVAHKLPRGRVENPSRDRAGGGFLGGAERRREQDGEDQEGAAPEQAARVEVSGGHVR